MTDDMNRRATQHGRMLLHRLDTDIAECPVTVIPERVVNPQPARFEAAATAA